MRARAGSFLAPLWTTLILSLAAAPALARDPRFAQPIDCTLGDSCFLLNLADADPGKGAADYTCGPRSYDGHKGSDFALPSHAAMKAGVDVLAAAPGKVLGARDGMKDVLYSSEQDNYIDGRDCGNGVSIDHGGGWVTQYCHLAQGSVAVKTGDRVRMGQALGQVGLSGRTQYPHVHLSIRKDGKVVDPFHPQGQPNCALPANTQDQLWQTPIDYPAGGIVTSGLFPEVPSYDAVKSGSAALATLPADGPALVGWSFVYGPRSGDVLRLQISGPDGVILEKDVALTKTQVLGFRAIGKKTRAPWPVGVYQIQSWLIRDGVVLDAHLSSATIE